MSNIMNEPGIEKEILRLNLIYEFNKFFAMGFDEAMKYKPSTSKYIQKSEMLRFRIAKCDLEKVKWLAKQDHRSVSQWLRNVVRVELERIEPVQNSFWVGSPNTTSSGVEFVSKGENQ